jgi:hypothetical protein
MDKLNPWRVAGSVLLLSWLLMYGLSFWGGLHFSHNLDEGGVMQATLKRSNITISDPSIFGQLLGRHSFMRSYWPNGKLLREKDMETGTYKAFFQDGTTILQEYDGHVRKSYDSPGHLSELIDYDRHIVETYDQNGQVRQRQTIAGDGPYPEDKIGIPKRPLFPRWAIAIVFSLIILWFIIPH